MLVFVGYRGSIARYVAEWGIAQICLCKSKTRGVIALRVLRPSLKIVTNSGQLVPIIRSFRLIVAISLLLVAD